MDGAGAAVGFDHQHLVAVLRIDVVVFDVVDVCSDAQRADRAAPGPVAVDVLDEHVRGWAFDGDAFVFVRYLDIVDVDVGSPDIYTIESAFVSAADDHVVDFARCAGIHDEMEGGSVDESDVVHGEVDNFVETEETWSVRACCMEDVTVALHCSC